MHWIGNLFLISDKCAYTFLRFSLNKVQQPMVFEKKELRWPLSFTEFKNFQIRDKTSLPGKLYSLWGRGRLFTTSWTRWHNLRTLIYPKSYIVLHWKMFVFLAIKWSSFFGTFVIKTVWWYFATGPCRGEFPRFYYDDEKGVCKSFNYTG